MTQVTNVTISDDGIRGEVISRGGAGLNGRPDGRTGANKGKNLGDTLAEPRLHSLATDWECTAEDFALIGQTGLRGAPSPAVAVRLGRACCGLAEGAQWTAADCAALLADTAKWTYAKIATGLGISVDRAEKLASLSRAFAKDERHPVLPLTHHAEVSALKAGAREEILRQAEADKLSAAKVRELVKAAKPVEARSSTGRPSSPKTREPRLPVAPAPDPSVPIARAVSLNPLPGSGNGTGFVPDPDPAPNGKTPPPSIAPLAQRLILSDLKLCAEILGKVGGDTRRAESMLADIVRAHFKL